MHPEPPVPLQGTLFSRGRKKLVFSEERRLRSVEHANRLLAQLGDAEAAAVASRVKPGMQARCRRWTADHYADVVEVIPGDRPEATQLRLLDRPDLSGARTLTTRPVSDVIDLRDPSSP